MKKTIFLSLPMKGRTDVDIQNTIFGMKRIITAMYPNDKLVFIDNFKAVEVLGEGRYRTPYTPEPEDLVHKPIYYLSKALEKMAKCDYIAVIENQNCNLFNYRGCYIEEEVARNYGLHFIKINDPDGSILLPDIKAKVEEERKACPKEEAGFALL